MLVRRQNGRRLTNSHPTNRNSRTGLQSRTQMYDGMDSHLAPSAKTGAMKDRCARRDKYLILEHRSRDMCIWTDHAMIANRAPVSRTSPEIASWEQKSSEVF
jgi:hypothetical protein